MIKRPKLLHIAHGIGSYNNSLLEMIRRMQESGIDVCVASHVDLSSLLNESVAEFIHLESDKKIAQRLQQAKSVAASNGPVRGMWRKFQLNRQYRKKSVENREIIDLVEVWKPDLLLIDMECHFAVLKLIQGPVKVVLCSRWFSVFRTGNVPPMHTTLMPAEDTYQSFKISVAWYRVWVRKLILDLCLRFSRKRFWPVSYASISRYDLGSIALNSGFRLGAVTDRFHWLIPHVYKNLPVMSFTIKELEFGNQADPRMNYVGPMVGQVNSTNAQYSSGLSKFLDFRGRSTSRRRLVYCSFSTFWSTEISNFEALLAVFEARQDLDLVVGLGGSARPECFAELPDNILVLEYAPQLQILQHSDVVLTHGGISTINEALYYGVPLIVCSSGHVDQDGCRARVVYHGVGLAAESVPLCATELKNLLDTVLDGERRQIQMNVSRIQRHMQNQASSNCMVEYIRNELPASSEP